MIGLTEYNFTSFTGRYFLYVKLFFHSQKKLYSDELYHILNNICEL